MEEQEEEEEEEGEEEEEEEAPTACTTPASEAASIATRTCVSIWGHTLHDLEAITSAFSVWGLGVGV